MPTVCAKLVKWDKFSLDDSASTDNLCEGNVDQPDLACTSQLQKWHKKGRGDKF